MKRIIPLEEIPADVLEKNREWQEKRKDYQPAAHSTELLAIFQSLQRVPESEWDERSGLQRILTRFPKDGKGYYSKANLIAGYRHLVAEGDLEHDPLLMKRFGELAGRGLAERLGGQISAWARGGGWNIFFSGDSVINHQYFDSLEAAVDAYTDIMRCFQDEAGVAIGLRMTENILLDVLSRLDANCRELLLQFIFTQSEGGSLVVRNE